MTFQVERLAVREPDAIGERAGEPVGGPDGPVQAQVVALEERVVPEDVDADARVEPEVDERDRREARLVVRPEGEEVVERVGQVGALGRGDRRAEGAAEEELAREVERGEKDARDPERDVAGRRRRGPRPS